MISLSDKEKKFLKSIVSSVGKPDDVHFSDLVNDYLNNIDVYLDYKAQSAELQFDQQAYTNTTELAKTAKEISWTFLKFIKLLTYLEKENYLYLYKEPQIQANARYGLLPNKRSLVSYPIFDPEVKSLLLEYSYRTIVVGQTLVDFVAHDFKTTTEVRHHEATRMTEQSLKMSNESFMETKRGIGLSLESLEESKKALKLSEQSIEESQKSIELSSKALAESSKNLGLSKTMLTVIVVVVSLGLLGIVAQVFHFASVGSKQTEATQAEIKLDKDQFQALDDKLKRLEALESKLDLLASQINTKDTLITKVTNFPDKKDKK
jgi:hypothetical protein